jgi:hypothetical protein
MMTKMLKLGLFVAILGVGVTVYADDQVDCSHVAKWDSGHTYKEGDLVTATSVDGGSVEFSCKSAASCGRESPSAVTSVGTDRQVQIRHGQLTR